jgi:hypothetical protein
VFAAATARGRGTHSGVETSIGLWGVWTFSGRPCGSLAGLYGPRRSPRSRRAVAVGDTANSFRSFLRRLCAEGAMKIAFPYAEPPGPSARRRPQACDPPLSPRLRCKERRECPCTPAGTPRRLPVPRFSGSLETEEQAEVVGYPRIAESKSTVLSINANFMSHSHPGSSATVSDHPPRSRDTGRAMSEENVEVVRRAYEAFNREDLGSVLEVFDVDMQWNASDIFFDQYLPRAACGFRAHRTQATPGRCVCSPSRHSARR